MLISQLQPEIWFGVFVIFAVTVMAALVTMVRRRSNRLRELTAQLRSYQEDGERHSTHERLTAAGQLNDTRPSLEEQSLPVSAPSEVPVEPVVEREAEVTPTAAAETTTVETENVEIIDAAPANQENIEARHHDLAMRMAEERAMDFASRQGRRRHPGPASQPAAKLEDMTPNEALSDWLNRRAAARTPQRKLPTVKMPPVKMDEVLEPVEASVEPVIDAAAEAPKEAEAARTEPTTEEIVPEPISETILETAHAAVFIDESLWESLLGEASAEKSAPVVSPRFELIQGYGTGIPAGMQDAAALQRLFESNLTFKGLVVSIGVNLNDGRAVSREMMPHVQQLIRGLLRDDEFACQTADDEFLLLCPGRQGTDVKRRLRDISEHLWDFQLRGVGNFSIMFHTGDTEADNDPLRDAVGAASARLQQTRRTRKMVGSPRTLASAAV